MVWFAAVTGRARVQDPNCKSFDAGDEKGTFGNWGAKVDDCALSYENTNDVTLKCDDKAGFNYFEKVKPMAIQFKKLTWDTYTDKRDDEQKLDEGAWKKAGEKASVLGNLHWR